MDEERRRVEIGNYPELYPRLDYSKDNSTMTVPVATTGGT